MLDERKSFQPTLQITISSLFITLIVSISLLLIWHNYSNTKKIVLSATEDTFEHIAKEVELRFKGTYKPAVQSVELISFSAIVKADTLEKRLQFIELFTAALLNVPEMSGLQVGYASGDYFIVRPLKTKASKNIFSAPPLAAFVVDNIKNYANDRNTLQRLFLDDNLHEIARQEPVFTEYDPRQRPWYQKALTTHGITAPPPYLFYFMRQIGTTLSYKSVSCNTVVGADITLEEVSKTLSSYKLTPNSELVLLDANNRVFAYTDSTKILQLQKDNSYSIVSLPQLGKDVLSFIHENIDLPPGKHNFTFKGMPWQGTVRPVHITKGGQARLLMVSPNSELLQEATKIRDYAILLTFVTLLLAVPITWLISKRISSSLRILATEARKISNFDFSSNVTTRSVISEVAELSNTMQLMKTTIDQFLSLINSISQEQDFKALLERITQKTLAISNADTVLTYLSEDDKKQFEPTAMFSQTKGNCSTHTLPIISMQGKALQHALASKEAKKIHLQRDSENEFTFLLDEMQVDELTVIPFPLRNRQNETIGLLCIVYKDKCNKATEQRTSFIQAFSGFAAVTLESRQLLLMQKKLLDSFIGLLANAIDAKSPYTGGHCQRVPVIAKMIAQAACDSPNKPFANFTLNDEEWEALHIASWLHDCGKVTTPEYVVDKATKLETIYDRIHEIRTRFEVLKRDAEINFWQQVANGADKEAMQPILQETLLELDEEFTFLAKCNEGREFMEPEAIDKLEVIAQRTWTRTLDDQLGISWEEKERKKNNINAPLPVKENLLDDKADHLIKRSNADRFTAGNPWGFKLDVPQYEYNRGELYNLKINRGTLSKEERYKINEHIIQTIIMLEELPYPKHLRNVPEIAGGHHETMKGTGYPRKLKGSEMSITSRMMVIADIFEALTASDRPYKKAKTLSQSIKIMSTMCKNEHIDPQIFKLFLQSGVHTKYASKYLSSEQIDEVDISQYLPN